MGRLIGKISPYCHCPVCMNAEGLLRLRTSLDDTAVTLATLLDILERHFKGPALDSLRVSGMFFLDGLTIAFKASEGIERKVDRYSRGECLTRGTRTLVDSETRRARRRHLQVN